MSSLVAAGPGRAGICSLIRAIQRAEECWGAVVALRPGVSPFVRRLLLALGAVALLAGLWSGVARLGWALPPLQPTLVVAHGPLMVAGFFGVVIGLERAVALDRRWAFAAPALAGLGAGGLVAALPTGLAAWLFIASGLVLVAVFVRIFRLRPDGSSALLAIGAALWLAGNVLWLVGHPLVQVLPWWAGFLVLTIVGERLELARLLLRSGVERGLLLGSALLLAGIAMSLVAFELGLRLGGLGLLATATWGGLHDVARRTVRRPGLPRFTAVCLLAGYGWLGLAGVLWLLGPRGFPGGWYDAMAHSLFLGFVFSMIFGHAPVIVPAVAGIPVPFRVRFYGHVGLLHGSLALRILGDLAPWPEARQWGGLLNAAAILLFVLVTATAAGRPDR